MKLDDKTLIFGLCLYSLGWIVLVINGISLIDIFANSLIFGGLFLLGVTISIKLNDAHPMSEDKK